MQEGMAAYPLSPESFLVKTNFSEARLCLHWNNNDILIAIADSSLWTSSVPNDIFQHTGKGEDKNVKVQKLRKSLYFCKGKGSQQTYPAMLQGLLELRLTCVKLH